jgi:hypothetical protein
MLQRCYNQNNDRFEHYGGRGIVVCVRWRAIPGGFEAFLADMNRRPPGTDSIDRINNDGNYSCGKCDECLVNGWPANCRWATKLQQGNNQRHAVSIITFRDETMTLQEWATRVGATPRQLSVRISAWGLERALTAPPPIARPHRAKKRAATSSSRSAT